MSAFNPVEYATLSREDALRIFSDLPDDLQHEWGLLYCTDDDGRRWTLFGDHEFCRALRCASGGKAIGYGQAILDEFPFEEFGVEMKLPGWPDEWNPLEGAASL